MTLNETIVRVCRARRGIKETSRNRSPIIDGYHRGVGLKPEGMYPWCCSGLYDAFVEATRELKIRNPFPKTAKAVRAWELLYKLCFEPNPAPGFVYVLSHGNPANLLQQWESNRYTDDGHIGIVSAVDGDGVPSEISGNTFAERGSREGNCWAEHFGFPEVTHGGMLLGYLNLERIAERPNA